MEGLALVPCVINTPAGGFRLLAVPQFDFPPEAVDPGRAAHNLLAHARTAVLETKRSHGDLEKQWTDDDGAFRRERRLQEKTEEELAAYTFREEVVRPGDAVYVVGRHSESRGGIVPDTNWAHVTRIMKGNGESVLRQLRQRIRRYLIGSILAAAAAAVLLSMFVSSSRP